MSVRLNGSTSGYTELDAQASPGNNTLKFPANNGAARQTMMTDGAGALSFQWDAGSLFYRLNADLAGANVNTAQSMFGVGVTLAANTVYAFEAAFVLNKSTGSFAAHSIGLGFGGAATVNNIFYTTVGVFTQTAYPSVTPPDVLNVVVSASNATMASAGSGSGSLNFRSIMRGTVSINGGGTFIPQYTLSAAPGQAYTAIAGSYIKFTPIGAAGSASSQGTWS